MVLCIDELGPGWTADGHWVKSEVEYGRGPEKTWVYGAMRPADGQALTMAASSRNSINYQRFLLAVEEANPDGESWSSPTTSPPITASPPAPGWRAIPASVTPSSRSGR